VLLLKVSDDMVLETLGLIASGVLTYYGTFGTTFSYVIAKAELPNKSTEKIRSMKDWKDTSKLKKGFYTLFPGVYEAMREEKKRRDVLEQEFMKKHNIKTSEKPVL
jgi:hypothetical protein